MTQKELLKKYDTLGMFVHLWMNWITGWWRYPTDKSRRELHILCMSGLSYREDR